MKKIGYIFLALLMLLQAGGLLLFYEGEQVYVKLRMKHALKEREEELHKERLTISLATYHKCRVGYDELRLNGKMYDIKSVNVSGDNVELVVVHDEDEEKVITSISNITGEQSDDNIIVPKPLIELMSFVYLLPEAYVIHRLPVVKAVSFIHADLLLLSRVPAIAAPPPWAVSCFA